MYYLGNDLAGLVAGLGTRETIELARTRRVDIDYLDALATIVHRSTARSAQPIAAMAMANGEIRSLREAANSRVLELDNASAHRMRRGGNARLWNSYICGR